MSLMHYCPMPNPWHRLLQPEADGEPVEPEGQGLTGELPRGIQGRFMHALTVTHVRLLREHRHLAYRTNPNPFSTITRARPQLTKP
jgi:hypothetical protein